MENYKIYKMKIYKFRPLATQEDLNRAKNILETGHFWCSKFSELNDPMEGAFHSSSIEKINEAFEQKMHYKICSFSGKEAFEDPTLWGYYANGFRGIAIEVERGDTELRKINYKKSIKSIDDASVDEILTTKLNPWKKEEEYRFLVLSDNNFHEIGKIKAVYFGEPYNRAVNKDNIYKKTPVLQEYKEIKERLVKIVKGMGINCLYVKIEGNKVVASNLNN